jgi:hypothetical protein
VLVFYEGQEDVQYGRDVWVPAHSTLSTWMLVGPAARGERFTYRDMRALLYDRSDGKDRLILPRGERRVRSRVVPYKKREPTTAILLDEDDADEALVFGQLPQPESPRDEALPLAYSFRHAGQMSGFVQTVSPGSLPPTAEAFDGIDHFMITSGRLADDPAGLRALRRWLERGGTVWVLLDMVDEKTLAPLLGDALDFHVVDRVSLTDFTIDKQPPTEGRPEPGDAQENERPVEFARVLLPRRERVPYTVNGWPAWFSRSVGRGKVVFSTLGARAWYRPRKDNDPPSPFSNWPTLPVPREPLEDLAAELQAPAKVPPFRVAAFETMLTEEIGYSVVSWGTVGLVIGAFLLAALALGFALRRSRRRELLGWLGPAAALGAAGVFVVLGEMSRRAAPPMVAVGQVVDAVSGTEEAAVQGLLAVYQPDSGPTQAGAWQGGLFELDMAGLAGQTRRFVLTDMDAWHWENLALPAGVRFAPFRYTVPTGQPLQAIARFGPEGLEGQLATAKFRDVGDALLCPLEGRRLAVDLRPDGSFRAGGKDILPDGQFLAGTVLSDRQQRRKELYREFLKRPGPGRLQSYALLAWAEPANVPFTLGPEARLVGEALLVIPLRLERSAPGTRVTVPAPFLSVRQILDQASTPLKREFQLGAAMHLRFQLPAEVLPLQVEQARLAVKINAPSRRVTIAGRADGTLVELRHVDSPLDPIRLDITERRLLRLDKEGGLHLNLGVSNRGDEKWTIEYLELEVSGRTE